MVVPLVFVWSIGDTFALPKAVALYTIAAAGLVILARQVLKGGARSELYRGWIGGLVITLLTGNIVAFALSVDHAQSLFGEPLQYQGLLAFVSYVTAFFVARSMQPAPRSLGTLFVITTATASLVSVYALMQRAGLDPIWDSLADGRVFSTLGQPNALAAYLVLALPLAAALLWLAPPSTRLLVAASLCLMVAALVLTLSRGGLMGFAIGFLVFIAAMRRQIPWHSARLRRWVLAVLVAMLSVFTLDAPMRSSAADLIDRARGGLDMGGFEVRQLGALWEVGVSIAFDHPFVGTGQETYPLLFTEYRDRTLDPYRASALSEFRPESPHNAYIGIGAGTGLPTLAIYVVLLASVGVALVRALASTRDDSRRAALAGLLAAIAGYAVTDAFRTPDVAGAWMLWVMLGIAVSAVTTSCWTAEGPTTDSRPNRQHPSGP